MELAVPHVKCGEHGRLPLMAWVSVVKEIDAPRGQEPLEWILLTNVPTQAREQAWERVDGYQCRPMIEEYHKAQKTGCGMEEPRFTTRKALEVSIAMLSVVAVQLLRLRDLSRRSDADTIPATDIPPSRTLLKTSNRRRSFELNESVPIPMIYTQAPT